LNFLQVRIGDSAPGKPESPFTNQRGEEHEIPHMDVDDRSVSIRRADNASLHGSTRQPNARPQIEAPSVQAHRHGQLRWACQFSSGLGGEH
jgi:hypothetical protein